MRVHLPSVTLAHLGHCVVTEIRYLLEGSITDDERGRLRSYSSEEHVTDPTVIHLGRPRSVLARGLLLLIEAVVVPGAVLYACTTAGHPMTGMLAVFAWRTAWIGVRRTAHCRVPTTCWFAFALFLARTATGVAVSSVALYLLVPVLLSAAQSTLFLGSAFTRRPLLMRLAADYTEDLPDRPHLRRVFAQMSGIWGGIHLASAAIGAWALTLTPMHAVAVTSILGIACTVASACGCLSWGLWRAARIPDLRIVYAEEQPPLQTLVPVDSLLAQPAA